jgi:quinol monooxygenase YgiN
MRRRFPECNQGQCCSFLWHEPGCLVFDVAGPVDPEVIYLYEIYRDDAAYEAHTQTAHFATAAHWWSR